MDKCRINIAIVEPSDMVFEGLTNLLLKDKSHFFIYRVSGLDELSFHCNKEKIHIVIINPVAIINIINDFNKLKKKFNRINWIGLIYSYFEKDIISKFNEVINIGDSSGIISNKLVRVVENFNCDDSRQEVLSERETDVLVQLLKGLSNKEIAEKLHISKHTVISHRKNIVEKTGIKSLPGLTIYAISKKIIPVDSR
ncbi:MAG: response regulator transcription factor [Bacteroidota bacterium]